VATQSGMKKQDKSPFHKLFEKDRDFFIQYLSVYFPFSEEEILEFWDVLHHGTAHYSVFLVNTSSVYSSTLGLCFNQNIRWTHELRSKWKIGFDNPFEGYFIGLGYSPIPYDDIEGQREIIPLDINTENLEREKAVMDYYHSHGKLEEYLNHSLSESENQKEFPRLSFEEFLLLYEANKYRLLFNRSIWNNTLYYEIKQTEIIQFIKSKFVKLQS
jgi:hypothetical protein